MFNLPVCYKPIGRSNHMGPRKDLRFQAEVKQREGRVNQFKYHRYCLFGIQLGIFEFSSSLLVEVNSR